MEWYACIKFLDDNIKDYFVPISSVFFNKNDTIPIQPVNFDDYDVKNKYYVLWDSERNERHPGYIRCIDDTQEKCKVKASQSHKRIIIQKKLTSSDTSDTDNETDKNVIPIKVAKVCKKLAQKESHDQVKTIYKKNLLLKNCAELTVHEQNSSIDMQSSYNNSQVPKDFRIKALSVNLKDCIQSNANKTKDFSIITDNSSNILPVPDPKRCPKARKTFPPRTNSTLQTVNPSTNSDANESDFFLSDFSILTDNSSNILPVPDPKRCPKARKTFPPRTNSTLQTVITSTNNDANESDHASPQSLLGGLSTPFADNIASFRRRFARLRSVNSSSQSPRRNVSLSPRNLFNTGFPAESPENEQGQLNPSASGHIQTGEKQPGQGSSASPHSRILLPQPPNLPNPGRIELEDTVQGLISPGVQPEETSDKENDVVNDDGSEDDTDINTQCKTLRDYKLQLYKVYKEKKFDMTTEVPEEHTRYEVLDDVVYLGLGRTAGSKAWRISKSQKYTTFLRDLSGYLWRERELAHRCLDVEKLKKKSVPGGSDIVLCSPRKLDLYLDLFQDYLNEHRCYKNLTDNEKDVMMKNSTETLSVAIRDARTHFIRKNRRRTV